MNVNKDKLVPLALGVLALAGVSLFVRDAYSSSLVTWMAIAALTATSLRFVSLIGELNFATAAFYGIGAYGAGTALTLFELPFVVALLAGGAAALVASAVFGYITLKTKGPYFLLIGFAFTEVMRILYTRSDWLGGNSGMVGIFAPSFFGAYFSTFAVLLCGLFIVLLYLVERSDLGKVFTAIRDNDNVVLSVGIDVHLVKVACFCIGSFAAGIAGALHGFANNVISPGDFGFLLSTFALAYMKVGGEDSPYGPITGAVLLVGLASLSTRLGGGEHVFYGAAIVLAVLLMPKGIVGLVSRLLPAGKGRAPAAEGKAHG
ncbi:MAG: branched-chain amino acid ABC transporter permease [Burkholderiales bacterium]|nr:MAG: branched-chain amino acid ABC transporter permease [Burkholderiales bacterium]